MVFLICKYHQPTREETRTTLAVKADNGIDCPQTGAGTFRPHKHHVIFPRSGPAAMKYVYWRARPRVWAIRLAERSTLWDCWCGAVPAPGLLNCISHQAAVPLISHLTERRLACALPRANKQSWSTAHLSHIWVWGLGGLIPGGETGKMTPCKRGIKVRPQWQEWKVSERPCPPKGPLSDHVVMVSKLLVLRFFFFCIFEQYLQDVPG